MKQEGADVTVGTRFAFLSAVCENRSASSLDPFVLCEWGHLPMNHYSLFTIH